MNTLTSLTAMLSAMPLALWVYVGLGLPWALVALPRADWSRRVLLIAVAFALGPALLTAWLFVLGTIGAAQAAPLLRFDVAFGGTVIIALIGVVLAVRKWRSRPKPAPREHQRLIWDERLLIVLIVAAVAFRVIVTAYWPFTAYDALWVYGFQGRLYTLTGFIPQDIGYYPQFLQLQYTFMQLPAGTFDDRAARAVIPLLHIGSILAAYVLGRQLFTRRVGIMIAAVWALYPHVGDWARIGDLEIPLTFLFTLSAALFLTAWTTQEIQPRRRYALLAGLIFGIAMWTKPTAGAFVWGVMLLVAVELVRVRFRVQAWWPRFEVAALTGLACLPLGAVWYVRNALLGLDVLVFPHPSWLERATQSGDLFGWPLLALLLLTFALMLRRERPDWRALLPGLLLIALALVPSMPLAHDFGLSSGRLNPPESRLRPTEWALLAAGVALVAWTLYRYARPRWTVAIGRSAGRLTWASLLALPYFITWFSSYSYHARLSFAIVPLLILPSAVILAHLFPAESVQRWSLLRKAPAALLLIGLSLPGILIAWTNAAPERDWLWTDRYPDDAARYTVHNPSIMLVKQALDDYIARTGQTPIVIAPGEQRLRFFYPTMTIDEFARPTRLDDLQGATHYLYGSQARWRYADDGVPPEENQIVSALARAEVMTQVLRHTDATFRYELYELHLDGRYPPDNDAMGIGYVPDSRVIFGDSIRYVGNGPSTNDLLRNTLYLRIIWEVLAPIDGDYWVQFDLLNTDTGEVVGTWRGPVAPGEHGYYRTDLWQPGEFIRDDRRLPLEDLGDKASLPRSESYRIVVSIYDPQTGERLPLTIDGERIPGDGYPQFQTYSIQD